MGDRSPKSNRKSAAQKQAKTDHIDAAKKAEIAKGQLAKVRAEATKKR